MRFLQSTLLLVSFAVMTGCAGHGSDLRHESATVTLDNRGGYSYPGRRVVMHPDRSYTDTRYTDVIGDETVLRGIYSFTPDKTQLTLSRSDATAEQLYRVDFRGSQYWVGEEDRDRIRAPDETWFRQISLRGDVP